MRFRPAGLGVAKLYSSPDEVVVVRSAEQVAGQQRPRTELPQTMSCLRSAKLLTGRAGGGSEAAALHRPSKSRARGLHSGSLEHCDLEMKHRMLLKPGYDVAGAAPGPSTSIIHITYTAAQ